MISVNDFKIGLTIEVEGGIWRVVDFQHVKPGKGEAFVRSKLKNLRNGSVQEKTFRASEKVAKAQTDTRKMAYLYESAGSHVFMDTHNYEQVELLTEQIESELNFLIENSLCDIIMYGSETIGVGLPDSVELEVKETEPGIRGETSSGGSKSAIMETGLVTQVPFFVNSGEKIIVKTEDASYVSRA